VIAMYCSAQLCTTARAIWAKRSLMRTRTAYVFLCLWCNALLLQQSESSLSCYAFRAFHLHTIDQLACMAHRYVLYVLRSLLMSSWITRYLFSQGSQRTRRSSRCNQHSELCLCSERSKLACPSCANTQLVEIGMLAH
jgi:hypothetical protein